MLFDTMLHADGWASAISRVLPGWTRRICRQYGLWPGAVDVEHYQNSAGRSFPSPEAAAFHYLAIGSARGWSPQPGFSPTDYRRRNPDVERAGYEPFAHWLRFGRDEGRAAAVPADPAPVDIRHLLTHRSPETSRATVDIVMPVHNSRALTLQAIDSVLGAGTKEAYELVVVDDASPDPLLRGELDALSEAGLITLRSNERNLGFVKSVNRGFTLHPERDVVLLNSDARVFGDWLDRLMAALRTPRTATATPLSNAATILSYPATLCENRLPADGEVVHWDALCKAIGSPLVEIPTGIGFCMAVSRACLDQIGVFDEERFGHGYGEENDFCLRATAAGWRHVAAPGLFVWHRGGASFGSGRDALISAAQSTLETLHPGYAATVGHYIGRDPLEDMRRALDMARIRADPRPKRLCVGIGKPATTYDVLDISLTPDLPPYCGQYRLLPRGLGAFPNLPRVDPVTAPDRLAALLKNLNVGECLVGNDEQVDSALIERIGKALRINGG